MAFKKVNYSDKEHSRISTVEPIRSKVDIERIINWFDQKNWHKYAVIFNLGVYSGLRISDILGLKVKEVRDQNKIIIREQKTGKVKEFPLQEQIQNELNEYVKGRPDDCYVFEGRGGRQLDRSQVYRRINDAVEALEIDANVGTHTLRKTFGYHFYKKTKNVVMLQKIFNHTSPDVTLRYIGIQQDEINKAYLTFTLDKNSDTLEYIALQGNNRTRIQNVISFCRTYIKTGGEIHKPFAMMILEIVKNTKPYTDVTQSKNSKVRKY